MAERVSIMARNVTKGQKCPMTLRNVKKHVRRPYKRNRQKQPKTAKNRQKPAKPGTASYIKSGLKP